MTTKEIKVSAPKVERDLTFTVNDWPETLAEKQERWGEKVCNENLDSKAVISAQGLVRSRLESGIPNDDILSEMSGWVLGVARSVDPLVALKAAFPTMTDEQKREIINQLKAAA